MTAPIQDQVQAQPSEKELNFRKMEQQYQRRLEETDRRREEAEKQVKELLSRQNQSNDDEEEQSDEPYVDHKKLDKKLKKFGQQSKQEIQSEIQRAVLVAKEEAKREAFLEQNPDFYEVLEKHADKFGQSKQKLAKSILAMPDTFERQVLVYNMMKEMGIDKPVQKEPSIQDKIEQNKRGHFYQPSNIGSPAYAGSGGDYSPSGQKDAYAKMQELKNRLKIG